MGKAYKIVVTGPFNAGKSEFIRTGSDIPVVSTERRITDDLGDVKDTTTVAMDYGQVTIDGHLLHLYGTPGQERFDFMWDILSQEMNGLLVLVDSSDRPSLTPARRMLRRFRRISRAPTLVVATKQDERRALPVGEVADALGVEGPVVACDPRQRASVHEVLQRLLIALK